MKNGKHELSREQTQATYILRRRRRELQKRLDLKDGSDTSLSFDAKEERALTQILELIKSLCVEKEKEDDYERRLEESY